MWYDINIRIFFIWVVNNAQQSQKQFNSLARSYEKKGFWDLYFKYSAGKVVNLVSSHYKNNVINSVLDVGCGTGTLLKKLSSEYPFLDFTGVDVSDEMLNIARLKFINTKNIKIKFINTDVHEYHVNKKFDVVICSNSFHHYDNQSKVLNKFRGYLNEKGIFILLDPVQDGFLRKKWTKLLKSKYFDEPYAKYYTRSELKEMMTKNRMYLDKSFLLLYFIWVSVWRKNE